jgi:AcrR family transcriptional regulator
MDKSKSERTLERFQDVFLQLLQERAYEAIALKEVAERAGTSRMTLYRHYPDKEALLHDTLERLVADIQADTHSPFVAASADIPTILQDNLTTFFKFIADRRVLFRHLFAGSACGFVQRRLRRTTVGATIMFLEKTGMLSNIGLPLDVIANYLAGAQIALAIWWVESDSRHSPELLAESVLQMGRVGLLGLTKDNFPYDVWEGKP